MVLRQLMLDNWTKKGPASHSHHPTHCIKTNAWGNMGHTDQGASVVKNQPVCQEKWGKRLKKSVFRLISFLNKPILLSQKCYHWHEEQPGADSPPVSSIYVNLKWQRTSFFHFKSAWSWSFMFSSNAVAAPMQPHITQNFSNSDERIIWGGNRT